MEDFEKRRSAFKSRVAGLQYIQIEIKKKSKQTNKQTNKQTDFSDATISNVLLDLPFIRKQPLE
jgi:hypothetical protein